MAKVVLIEREGKKTGYCIFCPACGHMHKFCTADAHDEGWPVWKLTGTLENPTVRDSLLVTWFEGENHDIKKSCHSFITDGNISYCSDSTHRLAGHTVELPEL